MIAVVTDEVPRKKVLEFMFLTSGLNIDLRTKEKNTEDSVDTHGTIHTLFEGYAQKKPKKIAVSFNSHSLSYDELNKKANQLAHYLLAQRLKADHPIAFCLDRSFECLITMLAILKAGAAYLPLDLTHPDERLLLVLKNSQASCLITQSDLKGKFSQYQKNIFLLDKEATYISTLPTDNPRLTINPQQLAYVIYTSGSTGTPKGVLIEHRSVVNYALWFKDYTATQARQRIDFSSNHAFDMAVTLSIVPLMLGLTIVICDEDTKRNTSHYLKYLKRSKIHIIKMTPSFFKALLQEAQNKYSALPHLKSIILGGENLTKAECRAWLELYPKHIIYNEYGPTETTVGISQYTIDSSNIAQLGTNIPIGTPGNHMYYLILDANNKLVANQEIGELYIGGLCLARGYLNQPELTQKQFINNPFSKEKNERLYKTGDLCRVNSDGILEYFGRTDCQVKIRGFRIEPGEIEKHLIEHPALSAAVVLAQKDSLNENRLIAYYITKENTHIPATASLRHYLQQRLPEFMIPSVFVKIDSLPLTANGKLDSSLLPIPTRVTTPQHRIPVTDLEKTLAKIWSEELGVETIGLEDDFFELGGHSLSAARIISKINHVKGTHLTILDFYKATTIDQLSILISRSKKRKIKKIKTVQQIQELQSTDIPLSDFQFMLWIADTFEAKAKKLNITARKRLQGKLDKMALEFAFDAVLKKQEVLFYRILKLRPVQLLQKNLSFKITEMNLESLPDEESETVLAHSMNQLIDFYPWPKDSPLIIAKLFYLKNNMVELQISIPHIICDDFSPEILLADLSRFYLLYNEHSADDIATPEKPYKEYILNEQDYFQKNLDRDIRFWEHYMRDAGLFTFSKEHIVKNMHSQKLPYSTYTKIEEPLLNQFKQFCAMSHMSINEGLCAAIALALKHCTANHKQQSPYIYMNIVKSTRNNAVFDETIGCFLRLEPVKITMNDQVSLRDISQQIHHSTLKTSPYQQCPDLVKLSAISTLRQKRKMVRNFMINVFTSIYATLFSLPEVKRKIFKLCSERLSTFKRTNNFLININIQKNFISETKKDKQHLFGLDTTQIKSHHYDLLKIDNFFDVCFIRDENDDSAFLVISANLKPEFRKLIAYETIKIMETASFYPSPVPISGLSCENNQLLN